MTDLHDQLKALRERAERDLEIAGKAAPGPWVAHKNKTSISVLAPEAENQNSPDGKGRTICAAMIQYWNHKSIPRLMLNLDAITHARTALPTSAQAVLRLTKALEIAKERIAFYRKDARDKFDAELSAKHDDAEILAALREGDK